MKLWTALAAVSVMALGSAACTQEQAGEQAGESTEEPAAAPPFMGTELADGPWDYQTAEANIHVEIVTRDLDTPWSIAFTPDGDALITERPGRLRVLRDGVLDPTPISGLPEMYTLGIAGLYDVVLHPDFAENRLVYLSYTKVDPNDPANSVIAIMRGRWDGGNALADVEDIFVAQAWYGAEPMPEKCCGQGPAFGSYGGRMVFDKDGYLYLSSGDRNFGEMVSNPANHFGKILRLNDDGTPAEGNPWMRNLGHAPESWTTGHRNPLGLTIDPETGIMWESEFGPRGGDEVNRIERGADYGWIRVTQGSHYDDTPAEGVKDVEGVTDAVLVFGPPSLNPGNLLVYRGNAISNWRGDLFLASFTKGLLRFEMDDSNTPTGEPEYMLQELGQRWRDVKTGPDGALYMLSDMADGALIRIAPAQ